ncbi:MAG: UvrD-helicase domain-containing protein [Acidaminococcaceae bacterium]|nr:UvrD-helicase domain-containing protein [Acidaminococcaceae bacterium]
MFELSEEQARAVTTLNSNLAVAAGAGSGKTRVLVERFIYLIKSKYAAADEILAITFTKKAAKEMRTRIRSALVDLEAAAYGEDKLFWRLQLEKLAGASISTIDSLCSKIMRENPVEAGVDPNFSIREEYEIDEFKAQVLEDFLLQGVKKQDSNLVAILSIYGVDETREMLARLIEYLPSWSEEQRGGPADAEAALVTAWQAVLDSYKQYAQEQVQAKEYYGFDEVAAKALELLEHYPHVLEKYHNKFKFVMVDEFQDTNLRQKDFIYLLAGQDKTTLREKRLFIVGDPKQSIYRFRGADVSVFNQVTKDIQAADGADKKIELLKNYRSTKTIIAWCNYVFRDFIGEHPEYAIAFQPLAARDVQGPKPDFSIINYSTETLTASQSRSYEAQLVADKIEELLDEHPQWHKDKIAILVATINKAAPFAAALRQKGINYQVLDGKGFYERQEIIDFLNLLLYLHNPLQDYPLVGVLRSPYFGLDDQLLTQAFGQVQVQSISLREALTALAADTALLPAQASHFQACLEQLVTLERAAVVEALPELIATIYATLHVEVVLTQQAFGLEKLANVDKLRQLATSFALNTNGSLADYLERVTKMRKANVRETGAVRLENEAPVTIMTIHKSKGLEYPAVFLPALESTGRSGGVKAGYSKQFGLGVKYKDAEGQLQNTETLDAIVEENNLLNDGEKIRQLYVAITRAEEYLWMSGCKRRTKSKSTSKNWLNDLQNLIENKPTDYVNYRQLEAQEVVPSATAASAQDQTAELDQARAAVLPEFLISNKNMFSATSLGEYDICPRRYFYYNIACMPEVKMQLGGTGVPAYLVGLVTHKALELRGDYSARAEAVQAALIEIEVPQEVREAVQQRALSILDSYCDSVIFRAIEQLPQQAEYNFCLPLVQDEGTDIYFQGSVDNLIFNPDGTLTIIDYKTGRPPAQGETKEGYMRQLLIYTLAMERLLGQKVSKAALHFLQNSSEVELRRDVTVGKQELEEFCHMLRRQQAIEDYPCQLSSCAYCPYAYFCTKQ